MLPVYKEYNNHTVSLTIIVYILKTKLIRTCKFLKLCHHFFFWEIMLKCLFATWWSQLREKKLFWLFCDLILALHGFSLFWDGKKEEESGLQFKTMPWNLKIKKEIETDFSVSASSCTHSDNFLKVRVFFDKLNENSAE